MKLKKFYFFLFILIIPTEIKAKTCQETFDNDFNIFLIITKLLVDCLGVFFSINKSFSGELIQGSLKLEHLALPNLEGTVEYYSECTENNYFPNARITFKDLTLTLNYDLDMAFNNSIPLYGNGKIKLVSTWNLIIFMDHKPFRNLHVFFDFQGSNKSEITGFWGNENGSKLMSGVLVALESLLSILVTSAKDDISDIISPCLENIVHMIKDETSNAKCTIFNIIPIFKNIPHVMLDYLENLPNLVL